MTNYIDKLFGSLSRAIPTLVFLTVSSGLVAQIAELAPDIGEIEEATVVGKHPGPALWRVENGANTLWIMGLINPMPKSLEWNSVRIERVLSEAEAVITPPMVNTGPGGFFERISVNRKMNAIAKLPDDQTLSDVLPQQIMDDLRTAKERYAPKLKGMEERRPLFVADRIFQNAMDEVGVEMRADVYQSVMKLARKHELPVTRIRIEVPIEVAMETLRNTPIEVEIECLENSLATIEDELQSSPVRAEAWSTGDIAARDVLQNPPIGGACMASALQTGAAFIEARQSTQEQWLGAAVSALETHSSTFTFLSMGDLVEPGGLLAEFLGKGYALAGL